MRSKAIARLLSFCVLVLAAAASIPSGASAATSVSGSAAAIVFDDPGTVNSPDPDIQPCTLSGVFCTTNPDAQVTGPNTSAKASTAVSLVPSIAPPAGSSLQLPTGAKIIPPQIEFTGSASAKTSVNSNTSAGISGTGQWSINGAIFQGIGGPFTGSYNTLSWQTQFMLNSTINSLFNFTFSFSGEGPSNTPFTAEATGSMTCTGNSCTSSNLALGPGDKFSVFLNVAGCNCSDFTLSETVTYQADVQAGDGQIQNFSYSDPTILTLLDSDGNVIPNLFLYDSTSNGLIGLSGQDFSGDETPIPATLPLFATGIGGLGLLGWRRKRKAQAV